jgi:hypothetical protein
MEGYGRTWFSGGDAYFDPKSDGVILPLCCCGAPTKETIFY